MTWCCPRCKTMNEKPKPKFLQKFQYGCTGISWLFKKMLPGHTCCEEHDVAYDQGGTISWKFQVDAKLVRCIYVKNMEKLGKLGYVVAPVKAGFAWLVVTLFPYAYVVWSRPEGYNE